VLNFDHQSDGQGSLEALQSRMESLSTEDVEIRVIHGGVGAISPNESPRQRLNAVLIGFKIRPTRRLGVWPETGVDLRFSRSFTDRRRSQESDAGHALAGRARGVLGRAEARQVFKVSKVGTIVGAYVTGGRSRATRRRVISRRHGRVRW